MTTSAYTMNYVYTMDVINYIQDSFGDGWSDFNGTQGWIATIDSTGILYHMI